MDMMCMSQNQMLFPRNKNASIENCGQPLTHNCTWAQGRQATICEILCVMNSCSVADVFVNATVEFLQNVSMTAEPFYLFLSFTTPHAGGIGNVL